MRMSRQSCWIPVLACAVLGLGCAESPEEDYREAALRVTAAQEGVKEAEAAVAEQRAELEQAQADLAEARDALAEARDALTAAESRVDVAVTDSHLFRAVQQRLLEDRKLEEVAVSAEVEKAIVTLKGRVETPEQRDRAIAVAERVPGVVKVVSRLSVQPSATGS